MNIVVDHQKLAAEELGLRTVGQMLTHLHKGNRLVVQLLVDGEQPDLDRMGELRQLPLSGHSVFVETVRPTDMALEVLEAVGVRLEEAEALKSQAVELLGEDQCAAAMQRLTGCFGVWQNAQESLSKTAQLLKVDLADVFVEGKPLIELVEGFKESLRQVRQALEDRDYVLLSDTLNYEMSHTTRQWMDAIDAMRQVISTSVSA